jgi:hypothetical protein
MLLNVRPCSAQFDVVDGGPRDAIFGGSYRRVSLIGANRRDLVLRQLRIPLRRAALHSSLALGVLLIVVRRAQKQVVRIHARRIVATVAHVKAVRDWAAMDLPRHAVGEFAFAAAIDRAVIEATPATAPLPASTIRDDEPSAESLCDCGLIRSIAARFRAVALPGGARGIFSAAMRACLDTLTGNQTILRSGFAGQGSGDVYRVTVARGEPCLP